MNHHILYVCEDIKRSSKIKSRLWFIGSARACFVCAHILFTAIGSYTCVASLGSCRGPGCCSPLCMYG